MAMGLRVDLLENLSGVPLLALGFWASRSSSSFALRVSLTNIGGREIWNPGLAAVLVQRGDKRDEQAAAAPPAPPQHHNSSEWALSTRLQPSFAEAAEG